MILKQKTKLIIKFENKETFSKWLEKVPKETKVAEVIALHFETYEKPVRGGRSQMHSGLGRSL